MKSGILLLVAVIVLGGLIGTLMTRDPGYVLISYDQMSVETSLWFAIALLVLGYVLLRTVWWLLTPLFRGGRLITGFRHRRRIRGGRAKTSRGLMLMAEGQWREAKKQLLAGIHTDQEPLVNYLEAARAADALGELDERDALLRKAHQSTPGSHFAVGLTHAELQFESGQIEKSIATLRSLLEQAPRHPVVLQRLADSYRVAEDWVELEALLTRLRKAKIMDTAAFQELSQAVWIGRLQSAQSSVTLNSIWRSLSKQDRRQMPLVMAHTEVALALEDPDAACAALKEAMQHDWQPEYLAAYGQVNGGELAARLKVAQGWLKQRPEDPYLLLCLGRLALGLQQWDQARKYFEAGVRIKPDPALRGELGRLLVAQGEVKLASQYLVGSLPELPDMPLPEYKSGEQAVSEEAAEAKAAVEPEQQGPNAREPEKVG